MEAHAHACFPKHEQKYKMEEARYLIPKWLKIKSKELLKTSKYIYVQHII